MKKPVSMNIPSRWIAIDGEHHLTPRFWYKVIARLKAWGIQPDEATDDEVKKAIAEASR